MTVKQDCSGDRKPDFQPFTFRCLKMQHRFWKFLASGSVCWPVLKSWWSWSKSCQKGVHVINDIIWQMLAAVWAEGPRTPLAQNPLLALMAEMFSLDKGWAWSKKSPCHSCSSSFPWMNKELHFQGLPGLFLSFFFFYFCRRTKLRVESLSPIWYKSVGALQASVELHWFTPDDAIRGLNYPTIIIKNVFDYACATTIYVYIAEICM